MQILLKCSLNVTAGKKGVNLCCTHGTSSSSCWHKKAHRGRRLRQFWV